MYLLRIEFSLTDSIVLLILAVILCFIVHFVLASRRRLQYMVEEAKKQTSLTGSGGRYPDEPMKPKWLEKKNLFLVHIPSPFSAIKPSKAAAPDTEVAVMPDILHNLKLHIRQQQRTLDQLVTRVDKLDKQESTDLAKTAVTAMALEEKEAELQKAKHQLNAAQKVAGRVTEVYQEFDVLQQKLAELEEAAGKAAALAIELGDVQQAYAQLEKDYDRKQEKLHRALEEAEQLRQCLTVSESKLAESNLQRHQLQKELQLQENINAELLQMSEANKKMKAELRRIAELESMLSLVSGERDLLLKKRLT